MKGLSDARTASGAKIGRPREPHVSAADVHAQLGALLLPGDSWADLARRIDKKRAVTVLNTISRARTKGCSERQLAAWLHACKRVQAQVVAGAVVRQGGATGVVVKKAHIGDEWDVYWFGRGLQSASTAALSVVALPVPADKVVEIWEASNG